MLIARAPLRISFAGGGTDLEAYYARHGGVVVSATINKYFYVLLSRTNDDAVQITSSDFRTFERRAAGRSEEHTSELQSRPHLVCRLLLEKKKKIRDATSLTAHGGHASVRLQCA